MAEIEFQRRGTPLWLVVLVLLVLGGGAYVFFGRGRGEPAPTAVADSATAPTPTATPTTAPAAPVALEPVPALAKWVDSATVPTAADAEAAYVSQGLRLLAGALEVRAPRAGAQIVLVRAMADTLDMPEQPAKKKLDVAQAAFFAAGYAMRDTPGGARINHAAESVQLTKPMTAQRDEIKKFFQSARDAMNDPSKAASGVAPMTPPPTPAKP